MDRDEFFDQLTLKERAPSWNAEQSDISGSGERPKRCSRIVPPPKTRY
jgi:hypothetical protein